MQIRLVSGRCFYYLRQLRTVRRAMTVETITTLVHVFIISRVDYCNSVLYGASAVHLHSLQSVLNAATRIIVEKRKFDLISTSIRDELLWLPIKQRIEYKLSALVFKCLRRTAPPYRTEQCVLVFQPTSTDNDYGHLHEIASCVRKSTCLGTALVVSTHLDLKHGTSSRTMPVTVC